MQVLIAKGISHSLQLDLKVLDILRSENLRQLNMTLLVVSFVLQNFDNQN